MCWPAQKDQAPRVLKTALKPDAHDRPEKLPNLLRNIIKGFVLRVHHFLDCCRVVVVIVVIAVNPHRASAASSNKRGKGVREQLPNVALEAAGTSTC